MLQLHIRSDQGHLWKSVFLLIHYILEARAVGRKPHSQCPGSRLFSHRLPRLANGCFFLTYTTYLHVLTYVNGREVYDTVQLLPEKHGRICPGLLVGHPIPAPSQAGLTVAGGTYRSIGWPPNPQTQRQVLGTRPSHRKCIGQPGSSIPPQRDPPAPLQLVGALSPLPLSLSLVSS